MVHSVKIYIGVLNRTKESQLYVSGHY